MTREESWQVEGLALTLLRHIDGLGFAVSVFRFPSSLLGTRPACVEMHAMDEREAGALITPNTTHGIIEEKGGDFYDELVNRVQMIVGRGRRDGRGAN